MYLFDVSTEGGKFVLGESQSSSTTNIQVFCHIDNGCFDESAVTIVDPMGHAPEVFFQRRSAPNAATSGWWRHFTSAVENAEGRNPVFKISRLYRDGNGTHNLTLWRGVQTTDFVTWAQSNTPVLTGGTGGTYDITFPDPLPAGRSYIAHNVYGRQEEAEAFAEWLLVDNASIAAPADVAYTNGVFADSVTENGDLGQAVGGLPRYAIKLDFGGSTTDGLRKRKLVTMYGIHAAGEGQAWWAFVESVKWLITSSDTQAQNLRANWDVWLYFNVNPNGVKSGWSRTTPRITTDPNRNWSAIASTSSLEEINTLKNVMHSDVAGACDAFFSFHGDVYSTSNYQAWVWTDDASSGTRGPLMQAMLDAGTTIWGTSATLTTSSTNNTDVWFGRQVLGAGIAFDCETPSMAGSTPEYFAEIGQNWFKSLEVVDASGAIVESEAHDLTGANCTQQNTSSTGAITQTHILAGANCTQQNTSSTGAVTRTHTLVGSDCTQANTCTTGAVSLIPPSTYSWDTASGVSQPGAGTFRPLEVPNMSKPEITVVDIPEEESTYEHRPIKNVKQAGPIVGLHRSSFQARSPVVRRAKPAPEGRDLRSLMQRAGTEQKTRKLADYPVVIKSNHLTKILGQRTLKKN